MLFMMILPIIKNNNKKLKKILIKRSNEQKVILEFILNFTQITQ